MQAQPVTLWQSIVSSIRLLALGATAATGLRGVGPEREPRGRSGSLIVSAFVKILEHSQESETVSDAAGTPTAIGRRGFLETAGVAAVIAAFTGPTVASLALAETRTLSFVHLHTGERLDVTYWADGAYVPDELTAVDQLLRDFRSGDVKPIDLRLLDRLHGLRRAMRSSAPYDQKLHNLR